MDMLKAQLSVLLVTKMKMTNSLEDFQALLLSKYKTHYELDRIKEELEVIELEQIAMKDYNRVDPEGDLTVIFPEQF